MIRIQSICKAYLISNGWQNYVDDFFIHKKIPNIAIQLTSKDVKYFRNNGILSIDHKGGRSRIFLSRLHHTFDRITFGRGKLPKRKDYKNVFLRLR